MKNTLMIDTLLIAAYFSMLLLIGVISATRIHSLRDYALGYTRYSWIIIVATLSASFLGGGFTMGVAAKTYAGGILAIIGMFGFSLKELIIAKVFAKRFANYPDAISIGDILSTRYGTGSKVISGILGLIVCAGIVGAQIAALGHMLNVFFGIPHTTGLVACAILLTTYTVLGGLSAVILTDVIQFWILIIGLPLLCTMGINAAGGFEHIISTAPPTHFDLSSIIGLPLISVFLTFLLGETLVPPYVQRLMIGHTPNDTEKGTWRAGLLSIPMFTISGIIGLTALTLFPSISAEMAMPTMITTVLPVGLKGIVAIGIISAIMSTADSFLQAGAFSFIHDALKPSQCFNSKKSELTWLRIAIVIIGILATIAALHVKSIIDLCIYAWTFWSPIILVPFGALLLGIHSSKLTFYISSLIGALTAAISHSLVMGVIASAIAFTIVHRFQNQ